MLDDFTLSLLQNRELIEINQHSSENRPVISDKEKAVWTCKDKDGNTVVALFNLKNKPQEISVSAKDLGMDKIDTAYDLWTKQDSEINADKLTFTVDGRNTLIFRLK